jgi:hypothetical protein
MALLVWSLGLATIYPPGSLIVTFEAHTFTETHSMSVMNPPVPQNFNFTKYNNDFPTLGTLASYRTVFTSFARAHGGERIFGYSYVD